MITDMLQTARKAVKYWWVSLIVGLLAIVLGILCLTTPDATLVALTFLFVGALLIDGILEIIFAISNRNVLLGWGWTLTSGILELLLGILLLALPLPTITVLLIYVVGFWILFRSIMTIGDSCQLQMMHVKGWGWLLALGILSVLFSFLYLLSPLFGGIFLIVFVGVAFLTYGIFRIALAFQLRSLHKKIKN